MKPARSESWFTWTVAVLALAGCGDGGSSGDPLDAAVTLDAAIPVEARDLAATDDASLPASEAFAVGELLGRPTAGSVTVSSPATP